MDQATPGVRTEADAVRKRTWSRYLPHSIPVTESLTTTTTLLDFDRKSCRLVMKIVEDERPASGMNNRPKTRDDKPTVRSIARGADD